MRVEKIGDCTLYLGNCRDLHGLTGNADLVCSDPPYGIAFAHGGNDNSGIGKGRYATKFAKKKIVGDDQKFDPRPLLDLAPAAILWGANHYADWPQVHRYRDRRRLFRHSLRAHPKGLCAARYVRSAAGGA